MSPVPAFDFPLVTVRAEPAPASPRPPEPATGAAQAGEVWLPAQCPRCGGSLLPVLLLVADGRRLRLCARCRRFEESGGDHANRTR